MHFLHLLIHYLTSNFSGIALAGTVMAGLPDLGSTGPIIDNAADSEVSDSGDSVTGDDPTVISDDAPEDDTVGDKPGTDGKSPKVETKVDWRTVPQEVKSHLTEIAKTNPKLANLLQNAIYTSSTFLREVPGGIKEIKELKTTIEDLGGIDEIKNLSNIHKNLVEEQETIDSQAREGNPQVLDTLVEVAGPEGFSKLMPNALSKWASADSQGYSHEISKIMVNAMREGGLVADLNLAFKMLRLNNPEATKEAMDCLNRCAEWANGIHKIAINAPERPKVDPKIAEQQQGIENEKAQLFNQKFSNEFGTWRNGEIVKAVKTLSGNKSLTDYQMNTLGSRIIEDIKIVLTSDPEYMKNLQRLYNSRNMEELQKFTRARTMKLLPEVAKKAYRSLFSNPTAPKKAAATTATTTTAAAVATPPTTKGWTKIDVSKAPSPDEIDNKKTSFDMKFARQAILKNGQKVYWGNKVPKD